MGKFPALNLYRTLINIFAALIAISGFVLALNLGQVTDFSGRSIGFNFWSFLGTLLISLLFALVLLVISEFIRLWERMEDHLDRIRYVQERGAGLDSAEVMTSRTESDGISSADSIVSMTVSRIRGAFVRYTTLLKTSQPVRLISVAILIVVIFVLLGWPLISNAITTSRVSGEVPNLLNSQLGYGWKKVGDPNAAWQVQSIQKASINPFPDTPQDTYCVSFLPEIAYSGYSNAKNVIIFYRYSSNKWDISPPNTASEETFVRLGCSNWSK